VLYRTPDGRLIDFPPLKEGTEHFDRTERLTLIRTPGKYDGEYSVRTIDRITYRFRELRSSARARPRSERFDTREHVLTGIHDASGRGMTFGYDERGRLTDIVDSCGRLLQLGYDKHGRISTLTAPHPDEEDQRFVVMQYSYDASGNLVQTVDALGQPATYGYDRHLLAKETDRNGLSFYFKYDRPDEHGKCLRTWGDGWIYDHKLTYDEEQNLTVVENSLGYKTQYFHDGALVTKLVDAHGGVTEYEYNEHFQLGKKTDALGNAEHYEYDERGNLLRSIAKDKSKVAAEWDDRDRLKSVVDELGGMWTFERDADGRVLKRTNALGDSIRYVHTPRHLIAIIDPLEQRTDLTYGRDGHLSAIATPDGNVGTYHNDRLGRLSKLTDPNGNSTIRRYDILGRLESIEYPDGNKRDYRYDREGHLVHWKDRHREVALEYRGMGRMVARTEADRTVRFEYDTEEQLVAIINEHGEVYRFVHGPTGRTTEEHRFGGIVRRYSLDACGRVTQIEHADGRTTNCKYDAMGRLV